MEKSKSKVNSRSNDNVPRYAAARIIRAAAAFILVSSMIYAGVVATPPVMASAPTSGTIGAGGPTVAWSGTAVATGAANESVCQEGVNCDTFTLTVQPGDYTGKVIAVKVEWAISANDHSLPASFAISAAGEP